MAHYMRLLWPPETYVGQVNWTIVMGLHTREWHFACLGGACGHIEYWKMQRWTDPRATLRRYVTVLRAIQV